MLKKIIAGGQTGVDQAALQAAIDRRLKHGGWCPPGRICEDGIIPERFNLTETPEERDVYAPEISRSQRTIWNVRDADGLLVFQEVTKLHSDNNRQAHDLGTELALETAKRFGKPYLVVNLNKRISVTEVSEWISAKNIEVMNVAGPSEGSSHGIYGRVYNLLSEYLIAIL
ncbi:MAG: putative molybdenum carrier protein [Balneolaceae bacterium]|nr:putative molybdenum carrier protein [Balneolaceae bacterium]